MHVFYVIDSLVPGGAETSLVAMAPYLIRSGIELTVAYFKDEAGLQEALLRSGASLIHLGAGSSRTQRVRRVYAQVRELNPDLVHTTLYEADVAGRVGARLARRPVVTSLVSTSYTPDHFRSPGVNAVKLRAAWTVDTMTAQLASRFHAVSSTVADIMSRNLHVERNTIDVVYRGRDPEQLGVRSALRRRHARELLGISVDSPVLLAVGRHEAAKGLDVLVQALVMLRSITDPPLLLVAGREGRQTPALEAMVDSLGLKKHVRFLGHREDVGDLLAAADVLAFPSRREGFPGTLVEALALECPIVAADIPTVREVVGGHEPCALLVPPGDTCTLAHALADVLNDPRIVAPLVRRGRQRFLDRMTIDRAAAGMIAFYGRALG